MEEIIIKLKNLQRVIELTDHKVGLESVKEMLSDLAIPSLGDEDIKEPIQNALFATNSFTVDECTKLSDGILMYLKDAGYKVVK